MNTGILSLGLTFDITDSLVVVELATSNGTRSSRLLLKLRTGMRQLQNK